MKKIVLFLFGLLLISCTKESALELQACGIYDNTVISFTNQIQPIIDQSCGSSPGCHADGAVNRPVINDYQSFLEQVNNGGVDYFVFETGTMPPTDAPSSAHLTSCDKDVIKLWIEQGTLNN